MPGPGFSGKASSGPKDDVEAAKRRDRIEGIKKGYRRTDAFEPQKRDHKPVGSEGKHVRMTGLAKDEEVKQRAREGKVIDNSVFYK